MGAGKQWQIFLGLLALPLFRLGANLHMGTVDLVGTKRWLLESVQFSDSVYIYI